MHPAIVAQQRGGVVFHLNAVFERGEHAKHGAGHSREPLEHVNGVDALVEQRAASLGLPAAAPVKPVVVVLGSEHRGGHRGAIDVADSALVNKLAHLCRLRAKAVVEQDAQLDAGVAAGGNHSVRLGWGNAERLFGKDMLARGGGAQGNVKMRRVRRGDDNGVHIRVGERVVKRGIGLCAEFARLPPQGFLSARAHANQAAARQRLNRRDMRFADNAGGADEGYAYGGGQWGCSLVVWFCG